MSKPETWNSKFGVILAVAGSAVGLGNFLKFPGLVAMYGGASFMIAYVFSFFVVGVPISILEWTIGRRGGELGYHGAAGLLGSLCRSRALAYFGIAGSVMTLIVFCYYIYIESWCLGYAYHFLIGNISFSDLKGADGFFNSFVGATKDGSAVSFSTNRVMLFLLFSFAVNFYIIYRGVSGGIEAFCKFAMPALVVIGIAIVVRMMTLSDIDPAHPERSINQGLGFMWNPVKVELREVYAGGNYKLIQPLVGEAEISAAKKRAELFNARQIAFETAYQSSSAAADSTAAAAEKSGAINQTAADKKPAGRSVSGVRHEIVYISVWQQLSNPSIWIAAAGQVFFSLTVGFSCIMTYASYLKKKQDVVLSSISSCSTNEFFEVCLGGMITVPAAVAFFGVAGAIGAGLSLFDLGFKVLPLVFFRMPFGEFFGFLFFFLLYLSAITSSISMLLPSVSYLEEATGMRRKASVPLLGIITFFITMFVLYFSKNLKAMDTFDFWVGQVVLFVFAMVQTIAFSWFFGAERGRRLANEGSVIKLPKIYSFIIKYITPVVLLSVFLFWIAKDVFGLLGSGNLSPYIIDLIGENPDTAACMSVAIVLSVYAFFAVILFSSKRYNNWKGFDQ